MNEYKFIHNEILKTTEKIKRKSKRITKAFI